MIKEAIDVLRELIMYDDAQLILAGHAMGVHSSRVPEPVLRSLIDRRFVELVPEAPPIWGDKPAPIDRPPPLSGWLRLTDLGRSARPWATPMLKIMGPPREVLPPLAVADEHG